MHLLNTRIMTFHVHCYILVLKSAIWLNMLLYIRDSVTIVLIANLLACCLLCFLQFGGEMRYPKYLPNLAIYIYSVL